MIQFGIFVIYAISFLLATFSWGLDLWNNDNPGGTPSNAPHPSGHPSYSSFKKAFPTLLTPEKFIQLSRLQSAELAGDFGQGQTILLIEDSPDFDRHGYVQFIHEFSSSDPELNLNISSPLVYYRGKLEKDPPSSKSDKKSGVLETMLDTEWAHVIAPRAKLVVIDTSGQNIKQLENTIRSIHPTSVAITTGNGNETPYRNPLAWESPIQSRSFLQWLSNHFATFVSSGDNGSHIPSAAVAPHAVLVGGIAANPHANLLKLSSYEPWPSEGYGVAKLDVLAPPFQYNSAFPYSHWRQVPDVAWLAGYPGVEIDTDSGWFPEFGTSLSAPCLAALWALCNEARILSHKDPLPPQANDVLYDIAKYDKMAFYKSSPINTHAIWVHMWGLGVPNPTQMIQDVESISTFQVYNVTFDPWPEIPFAILCLIQASIFILLFYKYFLKKRGARDELILIFLTNCGLFILAKYASTSLMQINQNERVNFLVIYVFVLSFIAYFLHVIIQVACRIITSTSKK